MEKAKTFVLVAIKGKMHQVVKEGAVTYCQSQRTLFKADRNWKGWTFQVRNKEAYKQTPILTKKLLSQKGLLPLPSISMRVGTQWLPYKD